MTIYEINEEIERLLDEMEVDEETGEIAAEFTDRLDELEVLKADKIDNIACYIKAVKAEAEAVKAEKQKLEKRMKSLGRKEDWLKGYLEYALDGEKFKSARVSVSYRKSESIEVTDLYAIPEAFLRYKEPEADKTKIKDALKEGQTVDGIVVVEKNSIIIK